MARSRYNPLRSEFVRPGHFYSAIADTEEALPRHTALLARDPRDLPGIELRMERQWTLLRNLEQFLDAMPFQDEPSTALRYGFANGAFAFADGVMLHLMLRFLEPTRILEVGSGHSTACMLDTIDAFLRDSCTLTCIDPFDQVLRSIMRDSDKARVRVIASPVQDVDLALFSELGDGDLLFIDSTHVSKVGSDVNFLFFEVLPLLRPGVVVHFHDVFPRFEYPWKWVAEGRAWHEDYLLRTFLQFNAEFEVLLWPSTAGEIDSDQFFKRFPMARRDLGSSIYLRRRGGKSLGL